MPTKRWKLFLILLVLVSDCNGKGPIQKSIGVGPMDFKRHFSDRIPKLPVETKGPQTAYYEHEDGARITKSSHFELDYMLGRKITFFCMATGVPRPEITWFKDGIELYAHNFFQVHEWPIGNDTIKSKMEIDPATQKDSGFYECQANNQYAVDSRGFRTDYVIYIY